MKKKYQKWIPKIFNLTYWPLFLSNINENFLPSNFRKYNVTFKMESYRYTVISFLLIYRHTIYTNTGIPLKIMQDIRFIVTKNSQEYLYNGNIAQNTGIPWKNYLTVNIGINDITFFFIPLKTLTPNDRRTHFPPDILPP